MIRGLIDQALLFAPTPGAIDTSVSGGVVVNARLAVAIEEGLRFAIREGGRTVGAGAVTKVIQ